MHNAPMGPDTGRDASWQKQEESGNTPIPGDWVQVEDEFPKEGDYVKVLPESSQERMNDAVRREVEADWGRKQQFWDRGYRAPGEAESLMRHEDLATQANVTDKRYTSDSETEWHWRRRR